VQEPVAELRLVDAELPFTSPGAGLRVDELDPETRLTYW